MQGRGVDSHADRKVNVLRFNVMFSLTTIILNVLPCGGFKVISQRVQPSACVTPFEYKFATTFSYALNVREVWRGGTNSSKVVDAGD